RIKEGSIGARFGSRVSAITPEHVELATPNGTDRVRADHVYLMVGYQPNAELLVELQVPIDARTGIPAHDPATMETAVPGVFIAGVIASGNDANKTFIENGRFHGDLIARRLLADRS
ncbi:MAG: NAD(P)-binding domain-containing protein, partial [Gemmatimonadaceae bacterium]